ncbi:MAG: hypothetical protein V4722_28430 [Bacteroidota bacterium]
MRTKFIAAGIMFLVLAGFHHAMAQNAGVGALYPNNGNLVIKKSGTVSALVVGDSIAGLSFIETSSPYIGFNTYYRNGRKLMADGYAGYLNFNHSTGSFFFANAAATGTQGGLPTLIPRLSINKDGDVGISVSDALAGLHVRNKSVLIDNTSGFSDIILDPAYNAFGGGMELQNSAGIKTFALRAADANGQSGELMFYNPDDNTTTMELDGDYAATGRSRIIVDELQIKGGSDFAEYFDVAPGATVLPEAGMLVSIDENNEGKLVVSHTACDNKVAGVISGANGIKPGMMMGHKGTIANGEFPVALTGRVYVKAEASDIAIRPGDLLTSSTMPGHAMKAANENIARGALIGKAMSTLEKGKTGMVLVLLGIQ